jgi:prevent-host-death family protein
MIQSSNFTARDLSSHSGSILDASQRGPVIITKQGRPFSVLVSYEDTEAQLSKLAAERRQENLKESILFGSKNNDMENNALTSSELNHLLQMVENGLSTDDMVQQIKQENGWTN